MQSPIIVTIRAAIMLLFLITVPLIAIFGKAFPEVVRMAAERYLPSEWVPTNLIPALASNSLQELPAAPRYGADWGTSPPRFEATAEGSSTAQSPFPGAASANPATQATAPSHWSISPAGGGEAQNSLPLAAPAAYTQAQGNLPEAPAPSGFASYDPSSAGAAFASSNSSRELPSSEGVPAGYLNPQVPSVQQSQQAGNVGLSDISRGPEFSSHAPQAVVPAQHTMPVQPPQTVDEIEAALRQLGATWYRLERWTGDESLFRFSCQVEIAQNSSASRYFESVQPTQQAAMIDVWRQLRAWRDVPQQ